MKTITAASNIASRLLLRPVISATIIIITAASHQVLAQTNSSHCGSLGRGTLDYRNPNQTDYDNINNAHFPPKVELLIGGNRGSLGGDISYTLAHIPNHHRALSSIVRYGARLKTDKPPNTEYTIECYFERGIKFRPDDHVVRLLYAQYLVSKTRFAEATQQINIVEEMGDESGFALYNIGMLYADMKNHEQALVYAHKAILLGFDKPQLRQRLEAEGYWKEPIDSERQVVPSNPPASDSSSQ